jgi:hypothetical protein
MKFFASVENGKCRVHQKKHFDGYLTALGKCRVVINIEKDRKKRTGRQNNLYWAWLEIIGAELGYNPEELHDSFRAMFLTDRSKKIPLIRSTTMLNTIQFGQYLDKIDRTCSELGIILPQPESI